jgi:hypothetical protein
MSWTANDPRGYLHEEGREDEAQRPRVVVTAWYSPAAIRRSRWNTGPKDGG